MERSFSLGKKLRALREERGLSQRELAALARISPNAVSLIERDETSPSVATLQNLASALQVKMSVFFDDWQAGVVLLERQGERPRLSSKGTHLETLREHLKDQEIEPFLLTLEPGANSGERAVMHTGHEFVYCVEGQLEYQVDGETYRLNAGDFLLFEAHLPHQWRNPTEEQTRFLLVLQTPQHSPDTVNRHFPQYPSINHIK